MRGYITHNHRVQRGREEEEELCLVGFRLSLCVDMMLKRTYDDHVKKGIVRQNEELIFLCISKLHIKFSKFLP